MTENQEHELIKTLGTLVNGVSQIQSDVRDINGTLAEHSHKLDHLVLGADSIVGTVMNQEQRLRAIEEVGGNIQ